MGQEGGVVTIWDLTAAAAVARFNVGKEAHDLKFSNKSAKRSPSATSSGAYITAAYSNAGVPLWTNLHGPGSGPVGGATEVAVDGSGNVVVTGWLGTVKYSAAGVPIWTNSAWPNAVAVDTSGNVFVTGNAITQYSAAGAELWTKVALAGTAVGSIALDSSGNVYSAGSRLSADSGNYELTTVKYSGAGQPLWTNFCNGRFNIDDEAHSLVLDRSGNVFVFGNSIEELWPGRSILLVRLNPEMMRLMIRRPIRLSGFLRPLLLLIGALQITTPSMIPAGEPPVAVSGNNTEFSLQNGTLKARVSKKSGDLLSLEYRGMEMLHTAGRGGGYWSHNTALGRAVTRVTIDPERNGGESGEVSIRADYEGTPLGSGPGGSAVADIEIRYTLSRGDSALFTCCCFEHKTNYPAFSLGEARFCLKLNDGLFDWMTVDARRNLQMLTAEDWNLGTVMNMKEARRLNTGIHKGEVEHKYDYTANQFDVRAWGWSSTKQKCGVWLINPAVEYLSGGPVKFELCAHRDATFGTNNPRAAAPPTLLNYWRSSHYGGSSCAVREGEHWTKVIGPFALYCNSGASRDALWTNALQRADAEAKQWPYAWVSGIDYPSRSMRGTVSGRVRLEDWAVPANASFHNLLVGLAARDYPAPQGRRGTTTSASVDWQLDAKYCQFWTRGGRDGAFAIPSVRPGVYHLHAIADGVLGEFVLTNVSVAPGQTVSLGDLAWRPVRLGRQLWEIGIPNRTGAEFFKGDDYCHWGWYLEYAKLFPKDITFTIGQSDFRKDWFFEQVPHNEDLSNTTGTGSGRATTWKIVFDVAGKGGGTGETPVVREREGTGETPVLRGRAVLRLALCGIGTRTLQLEMNGQSLPSLTNLVPNATINRDGIGGTWSEHRVAFDAGLMRSGTNTLALTVPAGTLSSGIIYDYLRLELDESN